MYIKFKIHPGKWSKYFNTCDRKFYYSCYVFDTKKDMWNFGYKKTQNEKNRGGYGALTIPYTRIKFNEGAIKIAPKIGEVLFYKGCLGSECISHEAVHLATSFLRVKEKLFLSDQIDEDEEILAYCIGGCTRQIVDNLYKLKIL